MRHALLKTAFALAVLVLTLMFLIPASLVVDGVFPMKPGPGGHYGGDRLFPGVIAMGICVCLSDRIVAYLFRAGRLTEERLSVFDGRTRRRPG